MADKEVIIGLKTTGATQAAAEVGKVADAIGEVGDKSTKSAGMGEELEQRFQDLRERAEKLREEYRDLGQTQDQTNSKMRLGGAAATGLAIGGAIVAKTFGEISKGLQSVDIEKLRGMDAAMAQQVETARGWAEVISDPINGIQRLISGNTIGEAFADLNQTLADNQQMQAEAIDRMLAKGIQTAEDLKDVAREIAAANAILEARDEADAAKRDREDAQAIRNGAAPEDVRSRRAEDDARAEIERINRGTKEKAEAANSAYRNLQTAKVNEGEIGNMKGATMDDMKRARDQVERMQKEYERAKKEFEVADAVAREQRRGVRETAAGTVAEQEAAKRQRLERDQEERNRVEAKRLQAELERQQQNAEVQTSRAAVAGFKTRDGLGRRDPNAGARGRLINEIGDQLGDADTATEVQMARDKILESQGLLGEKMVSALLALAGKHMTLVKKIEEIESQIKKGGTR